MGVDNSYDGIDEYAVRLIRHKARQLVGLYGFTSSDVVDLEQELILDLLQRLPKYNPERAQRNTYINRVINHKVASIVEARKAAKRDYRLSGGTLSDDIEDRDGHLTPRIELIDAEACFKRLGWFGRAPENRLDLKIDIDKVAASLPPELKELFERLKTQNVTEISKDTGIARSTIYDSIKKLRAFFEDAGLKDYL